MGYDPLFVRFIYEFNVTRDYFECHEVLEELWLGDGRNPLYQGLLQVAVGLYHHHNGNPSGAVKLLNQAEDKLSRYPENALGINLGKLLGEASAYRDRLASEEGSFKPYDLDLEMTDPELVQLVEGLKQE